MAKPPTTAAQQSTDLTVQASAAMPAFLQAKVEADAGKGVSNLADDNIVPLIYVLQALSPQCNRRDPDYIDGAKDGDLWLRNSGIPPVDGDTGVLFQPCYFSKDWVEWIPRKQGGGYVGRHLERPEDAVEKEVPSDEDPTKMQKKWITKSGNELKETRYHAGFVHLDDGRRLPFVIPFTGSGHTVSRQWMFMMNSKTVPGGKAAPSWACLYRLTTKGRVNTQGSWSVIEPADAGWVQTEEDYMRGAQLYEQMASGEKTIEAADEPGAPGDGPQGGDADKM